jgi:hypothetical protein
MRPWDFAAIELDFSPWLEMTIEGCADQTLCDTLTIEFTEAVDPNIYGKLNRCSKGKDEPNGHDKKYRICARRAFQILLMQRRILSFLLACATEILHDKTEMELLHSPVLDVPLSIQPFETARNQQTSFTSVLNMAPYRGWSSLDFAKLRGYVEITLNKHKAHIWALREDPGYFVDTIQECAEHCPVNVPSDCDCRLTQWKESPECMKGLIFGMLHEAYSMVHNWTYLKERLDVFDRLLGEGATKQQQARVIVEFREMTHIITRSLLEKVEDSYRATPGFRSLFKRDCGEFTYHRVPDISWKKEEYLFFMDQLQNLRDEDSRDGLRWSTSSMLPWHLEVLDQIIQENQTARRMVTGRILDLLTDLSIITECKRQASLWGNSPDVQTGEVDACGCSFVVEDFDGVNFNEWKDALRQDFTLPLVTVLPLKDKLSYPEHKKRTRNTTTTMCNSERNLDLFWAVVDTQFREKTGLAQHRVIKDCLHESQKMHRTLRWNDDAAQSVKPTRSIGTEYQPISNHLHDEALQITGTFDRMSVNDKAKPKTKGTDASDPKIPNEASVQSVGPAAFDEIPSFNVKKPTYKVFRALLHAPSVDVEETAKQVKWMDFIKAMGDMGFAVEKLQGSAWQFIPSTNVGNERNIQFHEPHPANDITPVIASRMGRRLSRVYGWSGDMFTLA